jgi:hypothetical protein
VSAAGRGAVNDLIPLGDHVLYRDANVRKGAVVVGRERAFTHLWNGKTLAIDLRKRKIVERWSNGCMGSRGIALDENRGFLFAGCDEGRLSVLDVKTASC